VSIIPHFCVAEANVLFLGPHLPLKPHTYSSPYPLPFRVPPLPHLHVPGRGACQSLIPMNSQSRNLGAWTWPQENKLSQTPCRCPHLRSIGNRGVARLSSSLHQLPRTRSPMPLILNSSTLRPFPPPHLPVSPRFTAYIPLTTTDHLPDLADRPADKCPEFFEQPSAWVEPPFMAPGQTEKDPYSATWEDFFNFDLPSDSSPLPSLTNSPSSPDPLWSLSPQELSCFDSFESPLFDFSSPSLFKIPTLYPADGVEIVGDDTPLIS